MPCCHMHYSKHIYAIGSVQHSKSVIKYKSKREAYPKVEGRPLSYHVGALSLSLSSCSVVHIQKELHLRIPRVEVLGFLLS